MTTAEGVFFFVAGRGGGMARQPAPVLRSLSPNIFSSRRITVLISLTGERSFSYNFPMAPHTKYVEKIRAFYRSHKRMPSYAEIMAVVGFRSKGSTAKLVNRLVDRHYLEKMPKENCSRGGSSTICGSLAPSKPAFRHRRKRRSGIRCISRSGSSGTGWLLIS
jgi:hypothetical protein